MTEAQWQTSRDMPTLARYFQIEANDRDVWLFGCACCWAIWHLLSDPCRRRVQFIEDYVDKPRRKRPTANACREWEWEASEHALVGLPGGTQAAQAVHYLNYPWRRFKTDRIWYVGEISRTCAIAAAKTITWDDSRDTQIALLRCIFGNPFRPAVLDPDWLAWNGGTVMKLARAIYEDRRWENMPILGDALEDAMCHDAAILDHCRGPGPHARGCWVVDLILGKE